MNRFLLTALLFLSMAFTAVARPGGYHIDLKLEGGNDSIIYLVHYYGKALPTIYKKDSAKVDKNGNAVFDSKDANFIGGIYMILLSDRKTYFEFLLNNGDEISLTANLSKLPLGLKFTNSPDNDAFQDYISFLKDYSERQQLMQKEYSAAKNAGDTLYIRRKIASESRALTIYRRTYIKAHPSTLLASIFNALEIPQVPEGIHYMADGKTKDSAYAYKYYKAHFWDKFNLQDDRLIHTPIFDAKLDEYINKLVLPWPDSIEHESNMLLARTKGTKELFKYTLWWLTGYLENSKVMGIDEAYVYLVENYYMKGDAIWLNNEELNKYVDRAMKIAPNVIGNLAPEISLPLVATPHTASLYEQKAKYTLLLFYAPSCDHCQKELPALYSVYIDSLKKHGLKVFTVATEGDEKSIAEFIAKNKLGEWTNTWDPQHTGDWKGKYNVYTTPTLYLLDENKIIKGKKLDHTTVYSLISLLEKNEQSTKKQ